MEYIVNNEVKSVTKRQILAVAQDLYKLDGVKGVTMARLAKEAGISTQVLHQFFCSKSILVEAVIQDAIEEKTTALQEKRIQATNSVEQVFLSWHVIQDYLDVVNDTITLQLKKFYPQAFKLVARFKNDFLYRYFRTNIERGITEGLYRSSIKAELLAHYIVEVVLKHVDISLFQKTRFSSIEIYNQVLSYHLNGMATEKGSDLVQKYKNGMLAFTSRLLYPTPGQTIMG